MKKFSFLRSVCFILLSLVVLPGAMAQGGAKFELGADLYSRYVWRGTDFGNSPAIQPWATFSVSGFSIGTWGSYATNSKAMQEADLFVSYDIKDVVTLAVTDYFFPNGSSANNNYFDYNEDSTGHVFEGTATFNGLSTLPLTLSVSYNFYGADPDNSLYMELGYGNTFRDVEYNIFVGGATGAYYLYGKNDNNFGIVNVGIGLSKAIRISETWSLPVNTSLITNPTAESIFIVFGISL